MLTRFFLRVFDNPYDIWVKIEYQDLFNIGYLPKQIHIPVIPAIWKLF